MRNTMLALASVVFLSACASGGLTAREKGALGGGALGAGAGAIIGHQTGSAGAGAAIGGALGALGGALVGDQVEAQGQRSTQLESTSVEHRRELERQRQEIEELKRDRRDDDYERY